VQSFYPSIMQPIYQPIIIERSNSLLQNVIPAAAVVISLIALFVSLWSLRTQRRHNRKSVRPAGHVQLLDSLQGLHVRIVNKGCGPMLINEFTAVRDKIAKHNIVNHLPENILDGFNHQFHTEPEGYWLVPGDELMLLSLNGDHTDQVYVKVRENVRSILSGIIVNLTFCDVYDEKHPVFEKSLSWFKRKL
jgi:hypothetical protein